MKVEGEFNKPITLTMETAKEFLAISTALSICLLHWPKDGGVCDSHIEIIEEAKKQLRSV